MPKTEPKEKPLSAKLPPREAAGATEDGGRFRPAVSTPGISRLACRKRLGNKVGQAICRAPQPFFKARILFIVRLHSSKGVDFHLVNNKNWHLEAARAHAASKGKIIEEGPHASVCVAMHTPIAVRYVTSRNGEANAHIFLLPEEMKGSQDERQVRKFLATAKAALRVSAAHNQLKGGGPNGITIPQFNQLHLELTTAKLLLDAHGK